MWNIFLDGIPKASLLSISMLIWIAIALAVLVLSAPLFLLGTAIYGLFTGFWAKLLVVIIIALIVGAVLKLKS